MRCFDIVDSCLFPCIIADCKLAAIRLYETGLLDLETILDCVGFSERTFYCILKLWRETGRVARTTIRHEHTRNFDTDDVDYLLRLVRQNPDYFLDELLKEKGITVKVTSPNTTANLLFRSFKTALWTIKMCNVCELRPRLRIE
jgi:hypothetical protein